MTVSAYQVDNVIKAYSRQNRMKVRPSTPQGIRQDDDHNSDVVTLSVGKKNNNDAYKTISYNLLDVILKTKER
jgi:hypothetical protein